MAKRKTRSTVRQVVWTQTAARQRRDILAYWVVRNKSNSYSLKLLKASNSKTELIAKKPTIFREADFPETRIASMGHYLIFYKFNSKEIIITAFWDNRQDPQKLREVLKLNSNIKRCLIQDYKSPTAEIGSGLVSHFMKRCN